MNEDRKYKIYAGARGSGKSLFSPDYFEDEELEATDNAKPNEALERIGAEKLARGELVRNDDKLEPYIATIKQALLELKAIKEAKPSEAMKHIDKILGYFGNAEIETMTLSKCNILDIKQVLLKADKLEKTWETVKEKDVDLRDLKAYFKTERGLQEYNKHQYKENELTQEEFNLLKEMLE